MSTTRSRYRRRDAALAVTAILVAIAAIILAAYGIPFVMGM